MSEIVEGLWRKSEHPELVNATIISRVFNRHRVDVYVPEDVDSETPVLVMHDGKNLFWPEFSTMGETWGVIPTVQALAKRPVVIGVWIMDKSAVPMIRLFELAPQKVIENDPSIWTDMLSAANAGEHVPVGDEYHRLVSQEIIPAVADELGIVIHRDRTALAGSSMGGLTSLYGVALYPELYGAALSLSTHWAYWDRKIVSVLLSLLSTEPRPRIWIDRGTQELDAMYEGLHEDAADYLREHGWIEGHDLQARVYVGTNHSEPVWRIRFPEILNWWLS